MPFFLGHATSRALRSQAEAAIAKDNRLRLSAVRDRCEKENDFLSQAAAVSVGFWLPVVIVPILRNRATKKACRRYLDDNPPPPCSKMDRIENNLLKLTKPAEWWSP